MVLEKRKGNARINELN